MSIQWTNPNISFCHNESIIEWDIKAANLSLIKFYNLAPQKTIDKIEGLDKQAREIYVGKISQKNKDFALALEKAFTDIIEKFISENNLDRDEDIISIKKDAVFVRNHEIYNFEFGPILFRPKGTYSGFTKLPKYEFYLGKDEKLSVKGISDNLLHLHQAGVLQFIKDVFKESKNWNVFNFGENYVSNVEG